MAYTYAEIPGVTSADDVCVHWRITCKERE